MPIFNERFISLVAKKGRVVDGTLCEWKTHPVYFELKQNAKLICSQPYPVLKLKDNF